MATYTFQHNGQTHQITLELQSDDTLRAIIDGRSIALRASRTVNGAWLIDMNGIRHTVYTAAQGNERHVHADGQSFTLTVPDARESARRRSTHSADGTAALNAQMPGKVTTVLAAAGDHVERGQTLMILEAMKMEIRVNAPEAGIVMRLLVETGQIVERGQLLAEISAKEN